MKKENPNDFPAKCYVCGADFLARYNIGKKAKVCTPTSHICRKGDKGSCIYKCCRSRYLQGASSQAINETIDTHKLLSEDEFQMVTKATYKLRPPIGLVIRFIAGTGCRVSEALMVRREDLFTDREGSTIKIPCVKREGRPLRTVDLHDEILVAELKARKKEGGRGVFFVAPQRTVQYNFSKILEKLGICDKTTGIHLLRHTRATQLSRAGAKPTYVAQQLGWSSLETAKRHVKTDREERIQIGENLPPVGS